VESTEVELLKANLGALLDVVAAGGSRVLVRVGNGRSVVLMSAAELDSIEETLAIVSDPGLMSELAQPSGDYVPIGEVLEELRRGA
jgi:prevent-host-death family protein